MARPFSFNLDDIDENRGITFKKTGKTITEKCIALCDGLKARIKVREATINKVLQERNISTIDVLGMQEGEVSLFANTRNYADLAESVSDTQAETAGIRIKDWQVIKGESQRLSAEKAELDKLDRMARNIEPEAEFILTFKQLCYLDF